MGFHPKMYATTTGITPVSSSHTLMFSDMAVDYWCVESEAGAGGNYVSIHPRVIIFFDDQRIHLSPKKGAEGVACAACYIPAGLQLWGKVERPRRFRHLDVHLRRDLLARLLGPQADPSAPIFLETSDAITSAAALVAHDCQNGDSSTHVETLVHALALEMFHLAGRGRGLPRAKLWLEQVKRHVTNTLGERISIDDLARIAGMSRTQFNRRFRQETGASPYQWVMAQRISTAQELMRTDASFVQIASQTGFADQAHFNHTFRDSTGQSPSDWQRRTQIHEIPP